MRTEITDDANFEPLTLLEALDYFAKQDINIENANINELITTVRLAIENLENRSLVRKQYRAYLDCFPSYKIPLDFPPVTSIDSITYLDNTGTRTTLASDQYYLSGGSPSFVVPAYGTSFPSAREFTDSVQITYYAGAANADSVDIVDKRACGLWLAHLHGNASATTELNLKVTPLALEALLAANRWRC